MPHSKEQSSKEPRHAQKIAGYTASMLPAGYSESELEHFCSRDRPEDVVMLNHVDDPRHLECARQKVQEGLRWGTILRRLFYKCCPWMTLALFVVQDLSVRAPEHKRPPHQSFSSRRSRTSACCWPWPCQALVSLPMSLI
jgi:hypothetical protein